VVVLALLLPGAATANGETPDSGIKHVVLCWLNEPGNAEHRQRVVDTSKELLVIPEVQNLVIGAPVPSDRPNVEDSFDVGLVMSFRDEAGLQTYLGHSEHMSRVRNTLAPLCGRVQIVDIRF
jgi:hypothetical protein